MNVINYIQKYGQLSFKKMPFNDLDNIVFSLLSYLSFNGTCIDYGLHSLKEVGQDYLKAHRYKDVAKLGQSIKDAYKVLVEVINAPRFANVGMYDYVYLTDEDTQFGAVTFVLTHKLSYVSFEGTDQTISGWKEDCMLACRFPVDSHTLGADYLKKHISLTGPNVIVGGHSKGGNTALVSAMMISGLKQHKIVKVYSNDGPGLRKNELESKAYKTVRSKYIHIVPHCSIVGMLLRHDKHYPIKSNTYGVFAHSMLSWEIVDNKLRRSKLTAKSLALERSLTEWLNDHSDEDRRKIIDNLFGLFEKSGIKETMDLINAKKLAALAKNLKTVDEESKKLAIDMVKYAGNNISQAAKKAM